MDTENYLSDFFEAWEFGEANVAYAASSSLDDIFSILQALEAVSDFNSMIPSEEPCLASKHGNQRGAFQEFESKRQKLNTKHEGKQRICHISVERNRRKQMNEHLSILRSLMPCFYVKRGDQASIIGGVVDYINELQQILHSLEAKKQRKTLNEVLSPRIISSPRPSPLSPKLSIPISPRTPQSNSPYKPKLHQQSYMASLVDPSQSSQTNSSITDSFNELVANSKSAIADVEVKFSGPNVLLKTVSPRIPGQALKIISALEGLSLEILDVNISTVDERMLNSFTIKIGIECQLSAEELAQQIQQTFC
ncbi:Transcription factor SPEECHLESS [Abeliophyllum distichum]|uniref:Transcription factor SPEECHLESS n=1 Tax=Abeliophyllum distichum TaxID=126358 RepID=A0ABD1VXR3_9LAMI